MAESWTVVMVLTDKIVRPTAIAIKRLGLLNAAINPLEVIVQNIILHIADFELYYIIHYLLIRHKHRFGQ